MSDVVRHPKHYGAERFGIECIQLTRLMPFTIGNAVKYVWRHADKNNPIEDLRKAIVYLEWAAEDNVAPFLPDHYELGHDLVHKYIDPKIDSGELPEIYNAVRYPTASMYVQSITVIETEIERLEQLPPPACEICSRPLASQVGRATDIVFTDGHAFHAWCEKNAHLFARPL